MCVEHLNWKPMLTTLAKVGNASRDLRRCDCNNTHKKGDAVGDAMQESSLVMNQVVADDESLTVLVSAWKKVPITTTTKLFTTHLAL